MERMNVNPTRMMLTSLKKRLKTAVRGHKLLEDKRDELMKEFLELARENGRLRQEVEKALDRVYKNFTIAAAIMSQEVMEESLMYPKQGVELSVGSKNIMSVDVPVFEFQTTAKDTGDIIPYGFARTSGNLDKAVADLSDVFPMLLDLAAKAGAWYVYQAVYDTSDYIKERVKRYHDYGIGVEGTILLGLDNQTEDDIKRLIDFLGEIDLDLAEFTVMTPFPHTKGYDDLLRQGRIFDFDWNHYNAGQVVFQPKHMSPERLQELYDYAWKSFYASESQEQKMFRLFCNVALREMEEGTYRPRDRRLANKSFGRDVDRSVRNVNL